MDRRAIAILLLALAGCTGSPAAKRPSTTPNQPPPQTSPGTPAPGAAQREPAAWLGPASFSVVPSDFMDLFDATAAWTHAAGHVQVVQLPGAWGDQAATDDDLRRIVADAERRGLAIAVGAHPVIPAGRCRRDSGGFHGLPEGMRTIRRLELSGVNASLIRFVALDRPYALGHSDQGPSACGWAGRRIAREVAGYISAAREAFPDVQVGDVEPLSPDTRPTEIERWIETFRQVIGSELAFFHLDVGAAGGEWTKTAKALESFCRSRGIPFGMVYAGQGGTDQTWSAVAEDRFVSYEAKAGGHPDEVIFQAAPGRPERMLPETQPGTLTHLVDRYFRSRTALDMELGPSEYVGSLRASGTLLDASGRPISKATIRLTLTPLDRAGNHTPTTFDLGTRVTDERGFFRFTFHPPGVFLHLGSVVVRAWFAGDDRRWPAYAGGSISV